MQLLGAGHPEICDLVHPVVDEDVCGFEIAVDDVEFAEVLETCADLEEHVD